MTGAGRSLLRDDGAGSVLAVTILAVVMVFAAALTAASGLAVAGRRAAAAADAAALAAADVASGLLPGIPCESAVRVAATNGGSLRSCTLDGPIATVVVDAGGVWPVAGTARAGPPGSP